jgi:fatty-acyl-CoA synthase
MSRPSILIVTLMADSLFDKQLEYIINHAEDAVIFTDITFAATLASIQVCPLHRCQSFVTQQLSSLDYDLDVATQHRLKCKRFVLLCNEANMPRENPLNAICYETLIADQSDQLIWYTHRSYFSYYSSNGRFDVVRPQFPDATAASLCYTSGTTGNPKGVLFSHRSIVLSSLAGNHCCR